MNEYLSGLVIEYSIDRSNFFVGVPTSRALTVPGSSPTLAIICSIHKKVLLATNPSNGTYHHAIVAAAMQPDCLGSRFLWVTFRIDPRVHS